MTGVRIVPIDAVGTHGLRRRVLRGADPRAEVAFPQDSLPGAFHLAAVDDVGTTVGVASFYPAPTPWRPAADSPWQLRGMAVDPDRQGSAIGRQLLNTAADRLREAGADVLWANVRDSAAGFYVRMGWQIVGDGFLSVGVPHHVGLLDLA